MQNESPVSTSHSSCCTRRAPGRKKMTRPKRVHGWIIFFGCLWASEATGAGGKTGTVPLGSGPPDIIGRRGYRDQSSPFMDAREPKGSCHIARSGWRQYVWLAGWLVSNFLLGLAYHPSVQRVSQPIVMGWNGRPTSPAKWSAILPPLFLDSIGDSLIITPMERVAPVEDGRVG